MRIVPVFLAGGAGERLWPISNANMPKQLLKLLGKRTLVQNSVLRVLHPEIADYISDPFLLTNATYLVQIKDQLMQICDRNIRYLIEPCSRNTAPAIAAFIAHQTKHKMDDAEIVCIMPCDHFFKSESTFRAKLLEASKEANQGAIVTFGILPTSPDTGYGYIKPRLQSPSSSKVSGFFEKPDDITAQSWFDSGEYLWNAGIFVSRIDTLRDAYKLHAPRQWYLAQRAISNCADSHENVLDAVEYAKTKIESFDTAIMEKYEHTKVLKLNAGWRDLGSWDGLYRAHIDELSGQGFNETANSNSKNLILSSHKNVETIGVEGLAIIENDDLLIIADNRRLSEITKLKDRYPAKPKTEISNPDRVRNWLGQTLENWKTGTDETGKLLPYVKAREQFVFCHAASKLEGKYRQKAYDLWAAVHHPWESQYDADCSTRKTYDIAHNMLASAWAYKAFGKKTDYTIGHKISVFLEKNLYCKESGGYFETCKYKGKQLSRQDQRRNTNTQLHLLEAFLAWYEVSGENGWLEKATPLVELIEGKFIQAEYCYIPEAFNHCYSSVYDSIYQTRVEPGHIYECIWLLHKFGESSGKDVNSSIRKLYQFASTWGNNQNTGLVFDAINGAGEVMADTSRAWPQAERLKAYIALNERGILCDPQKIKKQIELIFRYYLEPDIACPMADKVSSIGAIIDARPSVSTLYHLYVCFQEYLNMGNGTDYARPVNL